MTKKVTHSKMDDLWYPKLNLQEYLRSNKFTVEEGTTIFKHRTRMSNFKENFKNGLESIPCPLCNLHFDKQEMAFQCPVVKSNVEVKGNFEDIFKENIPKEVVVTLINISKFREQFFEDGRLV